MLSSKLEDASAEKEELLTKEQVLEELQDVAEDFEETGDESNENVGGMQGFAPGNGVIEEETIEEEEYEYTPLYAHHDEHDLDEMEEETIDHNLTGAESRRGCSRGRTWISASTSPSTPTLPRKTPKKRRRTRIWDRNRWETMASTRSQRNPFERRRVPHPAAARMTDAAAGAVDAVAGAAATMVAVVETADAEPRHR